MSASVFFHRATGAAALASTVTPSGAGQLREMHIHLSAASATVENLTLTLDSVAGAVYDVVLFSQDMNGVADVVQTWNEPIVLSAGDALVAAWTNTNARTYGFALVTEGT